MFADEMRPKNLDEVIGNEHIKSAIKGYFAAGNLPHTILLDGQYGSGKSQPLDAPVLTPEGWSVMGEVTVGSYVVGSDGLPTKVVGVFPQGILPVYRVCFSDGSEVEASGDHLWQVYRHTGVVGETVLTTNQMSNSLVYSHKRGQIKRYSVPLPSPIAGIHQDLLIDPYTLGALLGDGGFTTDSVMFSTGDKEIFDYLQLPEEDQFVWSFSYDWRVRCKVRSNSASQTNIYLKTLGLMGKNSYTKFIPHRYLCGSSDQRLELLKGLMDTDGSVAHVAYEFSTSSQQLGLDVQYLVRSLGGTCRISQRAVSSQNGPSEHPSYRLYIKLDICPFKLTRKANLTKSRVKYPIRKHIVSISPVGNKECQCIAVDAVDHLYITQDFTLTHNTSVARIIGTMLNAEVVEHDCGKDGDISTIRGVVEGAAYSSLFSESKVIILDEVHKLSKPAQDVLLKTTEDTPDSVYFILCTSESQNIIAPLKSRGVTFTVKPVDVDGIRAAYKRVMAVGKIDLQGGSDDWNAIISKSEGSLRVVYNMLDKIYASAEVKPDGSRYLATDTLYNLLGLFKEEVMDETQPLPKAVLSGSSTEALAAIAAAKKDKSSCMGTMIGLYNYLKKAAPKKLRPMLVDMAYLLIEPEKANNWYSLEYLVLKHLS